MAIGSKKPLGIGLTLAVLLLSTPILGILPTASGSAGYETRGPISIDSEEDMDNNPVIPDDREDNHGVRKGEGTAENPYVISRWRIRFDSDQSRAISIQGTSSHVVIRDVVFDPGNRDMPLQYIHVLGADNVRIEDLRLPGQQKGQSGAQVLYLDDAKHASIHNVTLDGNGSIVLDQSVDTRIRDLTIDGWEAWLSMLAGTYDIRDVTVENRLEQREGTGGTRIGPAIGLFRGGPPRSGPCEATVRDLTVHHVPGWGVGVRDGCGMEVKDAQISARTSGIRSREGTRLSVENASLRQVGETGSAEAGFRINGSTLRLENGQAQGFTRGLQVRTSSDVSVTESALSGTKTDVRIRADCDRCSVRNSSLRSVTNRADSTLDARWNWWGSDSGPAESDIEGPVTVEPWLESRPEGVGTVDRDQAWLPVPYGLPVIGLLGGAALLARRRD